MIDIRTRGMVKAGWWLEERAKIPCAVSKDGLLVAFRLEDVEVQMNNHYIFIKKYNVWYFNHTRDRECAEIDGNLVYANPSVLYTIGVMETNNEQVKV